MTPEIQLSLNPDEKAELYLEDDMVYAQGTGWTLTAPMPAPDLIRPDLTDFVCGYLSSHPRTSVDFQVLTAKSFTRAGRPGYRDEVAYDFVPFDGLGAVPLRTNSWTHNSRSKIEEAVPSLFGPDAVDLTALWHAGQAVPLYPAGVKSFARERAEGYRFRFVDPGTGLTRIIQVPGGAWRGICDMGLHARVAPRGYGKGIPSVGVVHPTEPGRLFGVIEPYEKHSIGVSDDGRKLLYNGVQASWVDDATLVSYLVDRNSLTSADEPVVCLSDVRADGGRYAKAALRAVDVLRWRGVPEEAIDLWLRENLPGAYAKMFERIAAELKASVLDVDGSRHSSGDIPRWAYSQAAGTRRTVADLCAWIAPFYPAIAEAMRGSLADSGAALRAYEVSLEDTED